MARTIRSSSSASAAAAALRATPLVRPGISAYTRSRPLVMPGDLFQGAGTAGYEETGIERVSRDPAAMEKADQEAGGFFAQVPTWAWALGAAGAVFLFMRWRGGKTSGKYAV